MTEPTFFWHDYETWGTSPKWDRASQFAGIRTDWQLNVIGKPLVSYCQPADDMLPHPEACLITGITPQKARAEGLCEADFFREIHQEFSRPGTCGAGYNSLRFDDEFTRYGFYRNFIDPYAREWQNGNSRWDLIDVVRLTRALRPEGVEWPEREPGVPSFRLELLTAANGIEHAAAHDALSDVYATIAMARLIRDKQPKLFEYCLDLRFKNNAAKLLNLQQPKPVLHVSRMIPAQLGCISPVLPVAAHPVNKNSIVVYDLRYDPSDLLALSADELAARLFVSQQDLPEGTQRIALKEVHLNKTPVLSPMNTLSGEAASEWQIDRTQVEQHWQMIQASTDLPQRITELFSAQRFAPETDPDAMLYDGFIGNADRRLCDQVSRATPEQLVSMSPAFQDERLTPLLFRYRARNWPETLNASERQQWHEFARQRLLDKDHVIGIDLKSYGQKLAKLSIDPQLDEQQRQIVDALLDWPQQIGADSHTKAPENND
ncbi:MAG: exodeoxyribonuclease I [Chromatiales bacterium]